jgi:putative ABC transport system ATP-binding protein
MIELRNIVKTFNRNSAAAVPALQDVSLFVQPGDFIVVVGGNGSGKTTLLNAIAGTVRIDSGNVIIDGQDVTSLKDYERSQWVARIFQNR